MSAHHQHPPLPVRCLGRASSCVVCGGAVFLFLDGVRVGLFDAAKAEAGEMMPHRCTSCSIVRFVVERSEGGGR